MQFLSPNQRLGNNNGAGEAAADPYKMSFGDLRSPLIINPSDPYSHSEVKPSF